ncbi:MAG: alpha/beta fold hydrolase [Anaerolineae bacterium]
MQTQFVTVQNIQIRVKEQGNGQPMLFIHGNPDSAEMWDGVIARLPQHGFRYLAVDLPGYGQSGDTRHFDWSTENRGRWIADVLDALQVTEPVIIVAHDHGGPFGASFAVQYPERVKKLVLQNTLFFADYEWHIFGKLWRVPLLGEYLAFTQQFRITLPVAVWYMKRGSPLLTTRYIADLQKTWHWRMGKAMLALYRASTPALLQGWEERLMAFIGTTPTLVLWGDKDTYLPGRFAEQWHKAGAQLVRFPEAGHWLAIEKPAEYAHHLTAFIQS